MSELSTSAPCRAQGPGPLWASEAALDPNRLVRRGTGRESVEVLGYSPSARRVLLVWIYTTEHPPGGS